MTEIEFGESIDCLLPYQDRQQVQDLIEQAKGISTNAVFMVLHEICRPPQNMKLDLELRLELLANWVEAVEHPLIAALLPISTAMIRGEIVPVDRAMAAMRAVARFPFQYSALAIACLSCEDEDGEVDALRKKVSHVWSGTQRAAT